MSQLQIADIRWMATAVYRDDMVNRCRHWMRILQALVYRLATECADVLGHQDLLSVSFILLAEWTEPLSVVLFHASPLAGGQNDAVGHLMRKVSII